MYALDYIRLLDGDSVRDLIRFGTTLVLYLVGFPTNW